MAQTLYTFKAQLGGLMKTQAEIDKLERKMQKLKKTDADYQAQRGKMKSQIADLNKSFDAQAGSMGKANKAATQLNNTGRSMVGVFKSAAIAIASAFAVRAIVGGIKGVLNVMTDFEAKMAAVRAISGATEDEFKKLEKSALKLGATTVFTARQVAELQEEYARLGFTTEEIIAASDATLDLAAATGESLSNSAQTAGSVLRAFGYEATQTQRIAETMATSFTNSALNLERFTEAMKFAAPVAAATGFTVEETTTMLMKLADAGLHGSIAGNALKKIFLEIGTEGSKLSKKLGGPVQGVEQMSDALITLADEGFGAGDAAELLGLRAAPAFLALIESAEGLNETNDLLSEAEGVVSSMAAIRLDTLQGDLTLMKSALEGLGLALGESVNLQLRQVVFRFTEWIRSITNSPEKLNRLKNAIRLVGLALVFMITKMAVIGIVKWINNIRLFAIAFKGLVVQVNAATGAMNRLKVAMSRTGFGLIAVAIGSIAAAFMTAKVATEDFGEEIDEIEMKTHRLVSAFEEQVKAVQALDRADVNRIKMLRQIKADFGDTILRGIDIELATDDQLDRLVVLSKSMGTMIAQITEAENATNTFKAAVDIVDEELMYAAKHLTHYYSDIDDVFSPDQITEYGVNMKNIRVDKLKLFSTTEITDYGNEVVKLMAMHKDISENRLFSIMTNEGINSDMEIFRHFASEINSLIYKVSGKGGLPSTVAAEWERDLEEEFMPMVMQLIEESEWAMEQFGKVFVVDGKEVQGTIFQELAEHSLFSETPGLQVNWEKIMEGSGDELDKLNKLINDFNSNAQKRLKEDPLLKTLLYTDEAERLKIRKGFLDDLDRFRELGQKGQEDELERMEEHLRRLKVAEKIYRNEQAGNFIEANTAMREGAKDIDQQDYIQKLIDDNKQKLPILLGETERYFSNLKAAFNRNSTDVVTIQGIQLKNTKNHYKKLLKLQSSFYDDENIRKLEQARMKKNIDKRMYQDELDIIETNLKDIATVTSEGNIGAMSAFIEVNKSRFDIIKEQDAEMFKNLISGNEDYADDVKRIIGLMQEEEADKKRVHTGLLLAIEEDFRRKENEIRRERKADIAKITQEIELLEMEGTIGLQWFDQNYKAQRDLADKHFKQNSEDIEKERKRKNKAIKDELDGVEGLSKGTIQLTEEKWNALLLIETQAMAQLSKDEEAAHNKAMENLAEKKRLELEAVDADEAAGVIDTQAAADKREDIEKLSNQAIETERTRHVNAMKKIVTDGSKKTIKLEEKKTEEVESIVDSGNDAVTKNNKDAQKEQQTNANSHKKWSVDNLGEQLDAWVNAYSTAFQALSELWDNRIALERLRLDTQHDERMEDMDRMEKAELESLEGNAEAQDAARARWEIKREAEQEVLDQKKRALEKKQFERDKKNKIAMAIMSAAVAVAKNHEMGILVGSTASILVMAMAAMQVALIQAQRFVGEMGGVIPEFAKGGMVHGPSHSQGGVKFNAGGRVVELEGGEAVINKRSTEMFRPQLSAMNTAGGGKSFAAGGITPGTKAVMGGNAQQDFANVAQQIIDGINDKQVFVTESSVTDTQNSITMTESNASLF
tara:strand:- start:4004 stop:8728 length:4725 start_codon:yes stop_codon:yes gene_type:complete